MTIYARLTAEESDRLAAKLDSAVMKTRAEIIDLARTGKFTRDQLYGRNILESSLDVYDDLNDLAYEAALDRTLRSRLAAAS